MVLFAVVGESELGSPRGDGRGEEEPLLVCWNVGGVVRVPGVLVGEGKSRCRWMVRGLWRREVLQSHRVPLSVCDMALAWLRSIAGLGRGSGALQRVEGTRLAPGVPTGEPERASAPVLRGGCEHSRAKEMHVCCHVPALLALPCPEPSLCPPASPP